MFFKRNKKPEYVAFMSGHCIPLEKAEDEMFSQKMVGDGYAIIPNDSKVYAPIDAEVMVAFHTGHAYGLKTKDGVEILIHLGIDTVELDGLGFTSHIKEGQMIKQGDLIAEMDLDVVKENGKYLTSMLIFTSGEKVEILKENEDVDALEKGVMRIA